MKAPPPESLFDWAQAAQAHPAPKSHRSRADQILAAFILFHQANPDVWRLFVKFTLEAIARGRSHYSSDCVCHRIRWHTDIETNSTDSLKINDNYTAYYARMFHAKFPEHSSFFVCRKRISTRYPAHAQDLQVFIAGQPVNEDALLAQLANL